MCPSGALATQYTYEPFGKSTSAGTATTNAFQYTGRENDSTGLYFYRARYYNPTLQRFISQDPLDFAGGTTNLYAYTLNSPTNFVDPSGRSPAVAVPFIVACLADPACAVLLVGTSAYLLYLAAKNAPRSLPQAPPISTPMDPGRGPSQDPGKKDPCEWPDNPEDMDNLLGRERTRVPDGNFPGRNKVVWNLAEGVQLRFEAHPYFGPKAAPEEINPHWQFKVPGRSGHDPKYSRVVKFQDARMESFTEMPEPNITVLPRLKLKDLESGVFVNALIRIAHGSVPCYFGFEHAGDIEVDLAFEDCRQVVVLLNQALRSDLDLGQPSDQSRTPLTHKFKNLDGGNDAAFAVFVRDESAEVTVDRSDEGAFRFRISFEDTRRLVNTLEEALEIGAAGSPE